VGIRTLPISKGSLSSSPRGRGVDPQTFLIEKARWAPFSLKGQVTTAPLVYFKCYAALCHRAKCAPASANPYRLGVAIVAP